MMVSPSISVSADVEYKMDRNCGGSRAQQHTRYERRCLADQNSGLRYRFVLDEDAKSLIGDSLHELLT